MLAPLLINNPTGDGVEHNNTLLTVFGLELLVAWQNEHTCLEFRYLYLPVPSELQDFLFPAAGIYLEQSDPLQVCGQLNAQRTCPLSVSDSRSVATGLGSGHTHRSK